MSYRFRIEGDLLVLQVWTPPKSGYHSYGEEGAWRDASVEDIPINDPFNRVEYVPAPASPQQIFD